jgi:hypothetical protein
MNDLQNFSRSERMLARQIPHPSSRKKLKNWRPNAARQISAGILNFKMCAAEKNRKAGKMNLSDCLSMLLGDTLAVT